MAFPSVKKGRAYPFRSPGLTRLISCVGPGCTDLPAVELVASDMAALDGLADGSVDAAVALQSLDPT
jgi:hypothetical protein